MRDHRTLGKKSKQAHRSLEEEIQKVFLEEMTLRLVSEGWIRRNKI